MAKKEQPQEEFTKASDLGSMLEGEQINKDDILEVPIVVTDVIELESTYPKKSKKDTEQRNSYSVFQFYEKDDKEKEMKTTTGGDVLTQKLISAKAKGLLPVLGQLVKIPSKANPKFSYYDLEDV